jgi:hypothetical protein
VSDIDKREVIVTLSTMVVLFVGTTLTIDAFRDAGWSQGAVIATLAALTLAAFGARGLVLDAHPDLGAVCLGGVLCWATGAVTLVADSLGVWPGWAGVVLLVFAFGRDRLRRRKDAS